MKKLLLLLLLLPVAGQAQFFYPGPFFDSTMFTFSSGDSLVHRFDYFGATTVLIDTSGTTLWQIGNTTKPIFSNDTTAMRGIMTDTLNPYPANANDFFVLELLNGVNCIVDFWHKYETDSAHAGGIVEFSTDSGATWMNIAACSGIATQNFYSTADTLITGQPAFMGKSTGEQVSGFQLMNCMAERTTATACFPDFILGVSPIYIRFRFVSDSTVDSLPGWMIDSVRVVYTGCGVGVAQISDNHAISVFPNPAYDELTVQSDNAPITGITITNLLGQTVYSSQLAVLGLQASINILALPRGVYLIRVNPSAGSEQSVVEKFVKE
jgi:hypothetical protein